MTDLENVDKPDPLWDAASIDVDIGEVKVFAEPVMLRAVAIGSCIAVVAYDREHKIGGLAHIMLPGRLMKTESGDPTKYAEDAIDVLLGAIKKLGGSLKELEISVVGGANVLREGDIPEKVAASVKDYLTKLELRWHKERIGGTERRSIFLDIDSGRVFYSEGDSAVQLLIPTDVTTKYPGKDRP